MHYKDLVVDLDDVFDPQSLIGNTSTTINDDKLLNRLFMGRESETKLEQLTLDDYNPITGKRIDPQTDIRRPSNVSKSMP